MEWQSLCIQITIIQLVLSFVNDLQKSLDVSTKKHELSMAVKKSDTLISFPVTTGTYNDMLHDIIDRSYTGMPAVVCIANVHMVVTAYNDHTFGPVVKKADIVTPDGLPLTWAMRLLFGTRQERVAGMDLLPDLIGIAETLAIPVFFYGSTEAILDTTRSYLNAHYPRLPIAGTYSPPFRPLSSFEENEVAAHINSSGARIVFVALGCPKQEKWMDSMKDKLTSVMVGVGGALPVMIGIQKRAPLWMQKSGLEWLYRLYQEPQRLFKRYAATNFLFVYLVTKEFFRLKIRRRTQPSNNLI
jgi:N-acetylglucosaminyldiphosphoundecaprenol N-acetyl-beta-D-mannosaminyltransferase